MNKDQAKRKVVTLRKNSKQPKTSQFPKYLFSETQTGGSANSPRSTVGTARLQDSIEQSEEDLFKKVPMPADFIDKSSAEYDILTPINQRRPEFVY